MSQHSVAIICGDGLVFRWSFDGAGVMFPLCLVVIGDGLLQGRGGEGAVLW